ncbi:MAG: TonB-dependent receptor, partial [Acidobacteriota bacterium]
TRGASARINGGRNRLNEIQLDGITAVNVSGGNVAYTPMVDALQEFKVLTNSFSAEYGRTGGGVILATIKSGTNSFRGTVFEFMRNDALNGRNFFALPKQPKPALRQNQFGAALGGPIRKDTTFFFADWQGTRVRTAATRVSSVPTPGMREGNFASGFNPIYDPATSRPDGRGGVLRDPFAGNIVPRSRMDPAAVRIVEHYPLPNGPGLANNYTLSGPGRRRDDQGDLRLDHSLGDRVKLMGRHSLSDSGNVPSPAFATAGNPSNYPSRGRQQNSGLSYIHTFAPREINELRAGFNRVHSRSVAPTWGGQWPSRLGVPNVPEDVFPRINISGLTSIGNDRSQPSVLRAVSYQLADNFILIRGRHYLKAGFDLRRSYMNNYGPTNPSGEFSFSALQTGLLNVSRSGVAMASFLIGEGSGFQFLPGLSSYLQFPSYDFYFQDDFKLSSRLTLNFGVRYEPAFHWIEKYNRISSFNPGKRTLELAGVDGAPRHFYRNDHNNFGPRFGLAYSLTPRMVARLGYGVYYTSATVASNPGTPLEAAFPWARSFDLPPTTLPIDPLFNLSRFPGGASTFDTTGRTAGEIVYFDPASRTPYMQSWNVAIQRELRANLSLEVAYAGTSGTKLYTPGSNLNQIPPELLGPPEKFGGLAPQQRRPFPEFQNIAYNTFGASSIYHSLQVKAEQRFAGGLGFLASYTWSKALDNGSGLFPSDNSNVGSAFRLQNRYDMRGERSIAADDQGHRFVVSYTYDLPW